LLISAEPGAAASRSASGGARSADHIARVPRAPPGARVSSLAPLRRLAQPARIRIALAGVDQGGSGSAWGSSRQQERNRRRLRRGVAVPMSATVSSDRRTITLR
jgi:hypothetical protein